LKPVEGGTTVIAASETAISHPAHQRNVGVPCESAPMGQSRGKIDSVNASSPRIYNPKPGVVLVPQGNIMERTYAGYVITGDHPSQFIDENGASMLNKNYDQIQENAQLYHKVQVNNRFNPGPNATNASSQMHRAQSVDFPPLGGKQTKNQRFGISTRSDASQLSDHEQQLWTRLLLDTQKQQQEMHSDRLRQSGFKIQGQWSKDVPLYQHETGPDWNDRSSLDSCTLSSLSSMYTARSSIQENPFSQAMGN